MNDLEQIKLPRYFDEATGHPLHLYFGWHFLQVDGVEVELEGVPLLKNEVTEEVTLTFKSESQINYFVENAKKDGHTGIKITPKPKKPKRYGYCQQVNFIYSYIDHEHIPGLASPWDIGFLTPVFFNLSVLNKYSQYPDYQLDLFSESYGNIKTEDWIISFGINRNQLVFMWLGDIDSLPIKEQYYLRSENVESDHEIHSEFYDAQIDCIPSPPSLQSRLLKDRANLDALINNRNGFRLYQLKGEVDRIIKHLHRPLFWESRHVAPVIETLNKIFVESLNIKELKNAIKQKDTKNNIKNLGGLKTFELWLKHFTTLDNIYETMTPFYVLYDFRIVCAHLKSDKSRTETLQDVNARLGLEKKNSSNQKIYDLLTQQLINSIKSISKSISEQQHPEVLTN